MVKELKYLIWLVSMVIPCSLFAQQIPFSTQYVVNPYNLTYSLAGHSNYSEVFINYRNDWTKVTGAPRTFRASGFGNVYEKKLWIGGEILSDKAGLLSVFNANLSATYKLQVENDQYLYFGLWGSFFQASALTGDAVDVDPNDPVIQNNSKVSNSTFNAGFGIVYNYRTFNFGLSMPTSFGNSDENLTEGKFKYKVQRQFQMLASYIFEPSEIWQIQTIGVFRKTAKQPATFELSAMSIYQGRFWGGLLYRNSGALGINLGGHVYNGFVLNYSYEIGLSNMNNGSGGSHEITLGYRFGFNETNFFNPSGKYTRKGRNRNSRSTRPSSYPKVEDYNYRRIK